MGDVIPEVNDFHVTSEWLVERDVRLLSAGVPRSGSTLAWQLACEIVGPYVPKLHTFVDMPDVPAIVTIRDPRDCIASLCRKDWPDREIKDETLYHMAADYQRWFRHAGFYGHRPDTQYLRYEQFWCKYDLIADAIENAVGIAIEGDREALYQRHSAESNRQASEGLTEHDPVSHIHPGHVGHVEPGYWKILFPKRQQSLLTWLVQPILETWRYSF